MEGKGEGQGHSRVHSPEQLVQHALRGEKTHAELPQTLGERPIWARK